MAGPILSLAAISGILFFIPALTLSRLSDQENRSKRPVYILGASGFILFVTGMLFKLQHWPLATLFIVIGIFLLFFLAFPLYTWLTWKEENHVSSLFIFLVIGSLLIIIPGAMVNLNLQHSYQDFYYRNNSQQTFMNNYLYLNNRVKASMLDSLSYLKADQLHERTRGVLAVISNIQEKMVQESEGEPGKLAVISDQIYQTEAGKEVLYIKLTNPFQTNPSKDFLFLGCSSRQHLNASLAEYESYLTSIVPAEDILKYKKMLDTETYLSTESSVNAEVSLMSGLHSLEIMKNGLLTVESCVLNKISRH